MNTVHDGYIQPLWFSRLVQLAFCFRTTWLAAAGFALALTLTVAVHPCVAQVAASLSGTVSDPSGAAVPDATVTATSSSTGISLAVATDTTGSYAFLSLPPATYTITVEKTSFKTETLTGVQLLVTQKATLDVQLQLGQTATSVEVRGEVPLVQTRTASISTVIGTLETTELPLNLRRFGALAILVPGTVTTLDRGGFAGGFNPFAGGSAYSANGSRSSGNNSTVDGVMNRALSGGGFAVQPTPDAVQEFRIETNDYSAAFGLASGSVITLVTKSGTNELHGSVYEFLRNRQLDARSFFSVNKRNSVTHQEIPGTARGKFIRNQFGFALGGPIKKDKTFFFGNLEPLRQVQGSGATAIVPTAAQHSGDLSSSLTGVTANLCGTGGPPNLNFDTGQLFDPATLSSFTCPAGSAKAGSSILVGNAVPGDIIKNIDPVAQKVLAQLYNVVPNRAGFPNFFTNNPDRQNQWIWQARVDHNFDPKNVIFLRYLFGENNSVHYGALPNAGAFSGSTTEYFRGQSAVLGWTHTFGSSLVSEARIGFQRNMEIPSCPGCPRPPGTTASFGIQNLVALDKTLEKYPGFNFTSSAVRGVPGTFTTFSSTGDGVYLPQSNPDMMETYQYHLDWVHGHHTTQVGAEMSFWQSLKTQTAFAPGGQFYFDGRFSSLAGESTAAGISPIADFLLGYPESAQRSFKFTWMYQRGGGFWNYYIQDDFRVRPNLTINYGLRYEFRRPATDKNGSYMSFLPIGAPFSGPGDALLLTALPDAKNDALCTDPQYYYLSSGGRCLVATSAVRNQLGFTGRRRQTIIGPEHYLFAPRLGISWRPTGSNKLVIHTGAGIYYDLGNLNNQHFGDNNPVFAPSQIYSTTFGAPPPLSNGQPTTTANVFAGANAVIPSPASQFVAAFLAPDYKTPKVEEWSFGLESQLTPNTALETDYVGNHGYNIGTLNYFANQPEPGVGPIQPRRPYPDFAATLYTASVSNSWYQALQTKLTKRMAHGFTLLGSYTWSKTLDDNEGDEGFTSGAGQLGPQDYNNLSVNKGPGATDVRHRVIVSAVYQLPFGSGQRYAAGKSTAVERLVGGWSASYIITAQSGFPITVVGRDFSNTGSVDPRPDRTCNGAGSRSISNFFNASCFSTAGLQAAFQAGSPRFGNSGRGILEGPRYYNLDLALLKKTSITERINLEFRAEAYNSLNKPQFGDPNSAVGALFGKILSTRAGSRSIQFGLKLIF